MTDGAKPRRGDGCAWFLAFWIVPEVIWWLFVAFFGPTTTPWILGGSLVIGFFVFVGYAVTRVLRGHDLWE